MKKNFKYFLPSLFLFFTVPTWAKTVNASFPFDKDRTWKALLIALSNYPLDSNDQESGEIISSKLSEGKLWTPLHRSPQSRNVYQIHIQLTPLSKNRTQVQLEKKLWLKGSFLDSKQELNTQGVEEETLLYRAFREASIDKLVSKVYEEEN